jgi:hypothetical protein
MVLKGRDLHVCMCVLVIQCQLEGGTDRFITGTHSVNREDLRKNLKFFQVPETRIQSIYDDVRGTIIIVWTV